MVVTTMSTSTLHNTSAAESTDLLGVSHSLRSPLGGTVKSGIVTRTDPRMVRTRAAVGELGADAYQGEALSDGVRLRKLENGARIYSFPDLKSVSPLEKLAVTAIKANQLENQVLDGTQTNAEEARSWISAWKSELQAMDAETKVWATKAEEAVLAKAQNIAGVTAPLGFFDPLGFSTDVSEGKLLFYREVEVKHGRVAMLASLGILVAE